MFLHSGCQCIKNKKSWHHTGSLDWAFESTPNSDSEILQILQGVPKTVHLMKWVAARIGPSVRPTEMVASGSRLLGFCLCPPFCHIEKEDGEQRGKSTLEGPCDGTLWCACCDGTLEKQMLAHCWVRGPQASPNCLLGVLRPALTAIYDRFATISGLIF